MANTVNVGITTTSNTFNQWRITDNLMANDVNEIARGNFTKPAGNVIISEGYLRLANASGGTILDVKDDARIDGLLSVDTIESDQDGHVYLAAGDITMGNRAAGGLFQANINTNFNSVYVSFSNATVGLINVNTRNVIVNTANTLIQNNDPASVITISVANTFVLGTNVTFDNVTTGSINVFNRLLQVNSGNVFFGNTSGLSTFNVHPSNVNFFGTNVNFTNTAAGSINVDNRLVKISAPNVSLTNTNGTAVFNVFPNTYFFGGTVNVANTTSTAVVNVSPNTFFFSNVSISGTANVGANTNLNGSTTNVSGNLVVTGTTNVTSNVIVQGTMNVNSNVRFAGVTATVTGNLLVTGASANLSGNLIVTGTANVGSNANVSGSLNVAANIANVGNLFVTQNSSTGNLRVTSLANIGVGNIIAANIATANIVTLNANAVGATIVVANSTINNTVIANAIITSAAITTLNITNATLSGTLNASIANVTTLNVGSETVGTLNVTNQTITGTLNAAAGNVTSLFAESLTVLNPIVAPSESDSASYRLRVSQTTRGDGSFGVRLGSAANGNAWITFDTINGNLWRVTANSTEGTYRTLITTQNVIDSLVSTSTTDAAALNSVKTLADTRVLRAGDTMTGNLVMSGATLNTSTANITSMVAGNNMTIGTSSTSNGNVIIQANGFEIIRVVNTRFIGVGTSTPNSNIAVVGNVWITTGVNAATINVATANITSTLGGGSTLTIEPNVSMSQSLTVSGNVTVTGNLFVEGDTTTFNVATLAVEDNEIILNSSVSGSPSLNASITIDRGTSTNTFLRWSEDGDRWGWSDDGTTFYSFDNVRSGLATTNTTFGTVNTTFSTTNTTFGTTNTSFATINTSLATMNTTFSGNVTGTLRGYKDFVIANTNVGAANTVNIALSNWYNYTFTGSSGNRQLTFASAPAAGNGATITIVITQDITGGKTPTWGNTIYWAGGQVPPATTTAGAVDLWTFTTLDGGSTFLGTLAVKDAR